MTIVVTTYRSKFKSHFKRLNRIWLEELFEVEPADIIVFNDPESYILALGGQIFFILDNDTPVGTCAIQYMDAGIYELAKMAVDPAHQGKGYGTMLMNIGLDFAHQVNASKIVLITDTKLSKAISLYERHGFRVVPHTPDPRYKRGNIKMERELRGNSSS